MSDATIQQAVAETILGTNITPQAPLTQAASAGDTSVFVSPSDSEQFNADGVLVFWDHAGERKQAIESVDNSTGEIVLNFTGRVTDGIDAGHAEGAVVGTGLMTDAPTVIGPMLAGGPVIFVYVTREQTSIIASRRTNGPMTVRIQHHTALLQDQYNRMDPNLWAFDQQETARANLATIQAALLANWHLNAGNGVNAQGLGDGAKPVFSTAFEHMAVDVDNLQFVAVLEVIVRPTPQTLTP